MVSSDDFDGKATNLNGFYQHINFEQKNPKPAIVSCSIGQISGHEFFCLGHLGSQSSQSSKEKFWATFEGGFFNFWWWKQIFWKILNSKK